MIQCNHVYKRYKNGTNALYDINLSVDQGEFVYVIGPTGSGKSTLIKLMDAEEMCTKGNVKVVGIDVGELSKRQIPIYRRNIGVVFQDYKLLPHLSVCLRSHRYEKGTDSQAYDGSDESRGLK